VMAGTEAGSALGRGNMAHASSQADAVGGGGAISDGPNAAVGDTNRCST
jgi:hypothetical protein